MKKLILNFKAKDSKKIKNPKNFLGGKGANLSEMGRMGLPVPPGFTISTKVSVEWVFITLTVSTSIISGSTFPGLLHVESNTIQTNRANIIMSFILFTFSCKSFCKINSCNTTHP